MVIEEYKLHSSLLYILCIYPLNSGQLVSGILFSTILSNDYYYEA